MSSTRPHIPGILPPTNGQTTMCSFLVGVPYQLSPFIVGQGYSQRVYDIYIYIHTHTWIYLFLHWLHCHSYQGFMGASGRKNGGFGTNTFEGQKRCHFVEDFVAGRLEVHVSKKQSNHEHFS